MGFPAGEIDVDVVVVESTVQRSDDAYMLVRVMYQPIRILSMIAAVLGIISLRSIPGTLVRIGWNGPRISLGAVGFRSTMSWWGGPPGSRIMIVALWGRETPWTDSAASISRNPIPPMAKLPIDRKLRRDTPSQNRDPGPRMFSMIDCSKTSLSRVAEAPRVLSEESGL